MYANIFYTLFKSAIFSIFPIFGFNCWIISHIPFIFSCWLLTLLSSEAIIPCCSVIASKANSAHLCIIYCQQTCFSFCTNSENFFPFPGAKTYLYFNLINNSKLLNYCITVMLYSVLPGFLSAFEIFARAISTKLSFETLAQAITKPFGRLTGEQYTVAPTFALVKGISFVVIAPNSHCLKIN